MSPPKKPKSAVDYMIFANKQGPKSEPILLKDPKAQSALIRRAIFKMKD